ncbi:DEAD/DEAH box helicase [Chenggangzhangella methanolivorans]|uniref:DEAD/DEAH box helicase n=1 Tax=Chenggangzhangella methanolivorans TaxID=1437009 RepID=A0A9E6R7L7_9HYPH|nr:DEAD/DEAH box helicase [Chenggangzhangella methanolivorans]
MTERGYAQLTPVQSAVLEPEAAGRDLLVSAQTGSGKTVAYGLTLGETLLQGAETLGQAARPLALVVAPTRELAMQVEREFVWLYAAAGARIAACVGGMDPRSERRRLEHGAHIVVGTPGRLRDHITRGALDLSALKAVVLDEADEMLDLGFREDLEFILEAAPAERRTLLFSATLPDAIVSIARRFQRDAFRIATVGEARAHADIEHRAIRVAPRESHAAVVNVLRQQDAAAAIVFCTTRESVRRLHQHLAKRGFSAVLLSGELGQGERNRALEEIRDGRARVCVATDVAARGIDLANVELVVHADLPHDAETFQHRSGRTGRAGRKGVSVLIAPASRRRKAELLFSDIGVTPIWSAPPSAAEIRAMDEERLAADLAGSAPASDDELARARALLERGGAEAVAVALLRLQRAQLPEPERVEDVGDWAAPRQRARPEGGARPDGGTRPDGGARLHRREEFGDAVWFRLGVGRKQNADPKWLLPMLCRRGGVTRDEIGAIRIFDRETKVGIAAEAAERFAAAALGTEKGDVVISRRRRRAGGSAASEPKLGAEHRRHRKRSASSPRPAQGRRRPPRRRASGQAQAEVPRRRPAAWGPAPWGSAGDGRPWRGQILRQAPSRAADAWRAREIGTSGQEARRRKVT